MTDLQAQPAEVPQTARQWAALDQMFLQVAGSLDLQSTLQTIVDTAAALSGSDTASLYLRTDTGKFQVRASFGISLDSLQGIVLTQQTGLMSTLCRTGAPTQVTDFRQEVPASGDVLNVVHELQIHATLAVPLMREGECLGALYVAKCAHQSFSSDVIALLQRLATVALVALHNAEQYTSVRSERERLQAYLDAVPEGVIIFDGDGNIELTNDAFRRELGIHMVLAGQSLSGPAVALSDGRERPVNFRYDPAVMFQRVLTTGEPQQGLIEVENPRQSYEVYLCPFRPGATEVQGVVATIRDITVPLELERERSHAHLLAQLLDLSAMLNSDLSVAVLMERVVEAAMTLLGATSGTLGLVEGDRLNFRRYHLPDGWTDFPVSLAAGEGVPGHVWSTAAPYTTNDCEHDPIVLHPIQGKMQFKRLVCAPVFDRASQVIGTLVAYDPIGERDFGKADEEALQLLAHQVAIALENARLSQLKDEFLSIVSHELKTPVTSIKGFAQILRRRMEPDVQGQSAHYLDVINQQADRLTGLITDLLDLSRIQTGRFVFERSLLDYGCLVRDVVEEMELACPGNAISVTGLSAVMVEGNADRLRQVLVNLIENAVRHGPPEGEIHITLERSGTGVDTYVCDQGTGLPAGESERIFAQYYQVRQGSDRYARGLGLGLFISRQIVEEHRGRIWLDITDHTSFCFTLPGAPTDVANLGPVH